MNKLFLACAFAVGSAVLFGQIKATAPPAIVSVQTTITVEAQHDGEATIPQLKAGELIASKGDKRFSVTDLVPLRGRNAGLQLFLLVDDASTTSLGSQLDDLKHFIQNQPASSSIGIGYMRNAITTVVQNLTPNHAEAAKALRLPLSSFGAMTSPYLSLRDLIERWPETSERREVIIITSGVDPMGDFGPTNAYLDSVIELAQRQGIIVYSIYTPTIGHARHSFWRLTLAQSHLAQLSDETGGESYMLGFGPPVSFAPYLAEIAKDLANQYRVTLRMPAEDRGLREVRFSTEVPGADITAPRAVYVPAARQPSEN